MSENKTDAGRQRDWSISQTVVAQKNSSHCLLGRLGLETESITDPNTVARVLVQSEQRHSMDSN